MRAEWQERPFLMKQIRQEANQFDCRTVGAASEKHLEKASWIASERLLKCILSHSKELSDEYTDEQTDNMMINILE